MDILTALEILRRNVPAETALSPPERDIFAELDLWYWRRIGQPPRLSRARANLLALNEPEALSEFERSILEIFLAERAIAWSCEPRAETRFVKFEKAYATDRKGIHCDPDQAPGDRRFPSISLGEQAREYRDFVAQHGPDRIRLALERLVERGWLCTGLTSDQKTHYYLRPERVCLRVDPPEITDYRHIVDRLLLVIAPHTAEVPAERMPENTCAASRTTSTHPASFPTTLFGATRCIWSPMKRDRDGSSPGISPTWPSRKANPKSQT